MLKTPEQIEADNEAWWATQTADYPFKATSSLDRDNLPPSDFSEALYKPFGRFVMVPFPVSRQLRWGFKTEAARDAFIAAVGKGLLPIKAIMESGPEPDPFDFL